MSSRSLVSAFAVALCLFSASSYASADVGVGVETFLTGAPVATANVGPGQTGAAAFVYDTGRFHVDGLFSVIVVEDTATTFGLAGRFYWTVHRHLITDFSIGGGLGIVQVDPDMASDRTDIHLELGAKIRLFAAENLAVHSTLGLGMLIAEDSGNDIFGIAGRLTGAIGVTYFFR